MQARAALAFAYEQWDRPNPFAKVKPPKSDSPPPVGYLQAHDLARLLDFLNQQLGEWRTLQEQHRGMKVFAARGLKFCRSEYVFAGPGGQPYTNQSFNAHLGRACKDLRLQTILTAHGLRHSAATILLNDQGKNLREVQEALRHRDIRTTARYTHVAPEHARATMDALGGSLPAPRMSCPARGGRREKAVACPTNRGAAPGARVRVVGLQIVGGRASEAVGRTAPRSTSDNSRPAHSRARFRGWYGPPRPGCPGWFPTR